MPTAIHLERIRGHTICPSDLNPASVVIDAGAHRGEFSRSLMGRYGCKCLLVEANPELAAELAAKDFTQVLPVALSGKDSRTTFIKRENPEAGGIFGRMDEGAKTACQIETISLGTLTSRLGLTRIDLLKMDIEGAEFELLEKSSDECLSSISQITVEFHDFLPEFKGRGLYEKAARRLKALGFIVCCMAFRTHGDVLFLNRKIVGRNPFARLWLQHASRWLAKLKAC